MAETFEIPPLESGLYEHYKGNKYRVLGVGRHTEVDEYFVVYSPVEKTPGKPSIWLRPHSMFLETVEIDGQVVPRFRKIGE